MSRKIRVETTQFVILSDLVPVQWHGWFYDWLSETGKVTWGDANRTMITAEFLADIVEDICIDPDETTQGAMREWIKKVRNLGQMYVDLEN